MDHSEVKHLPKVDHTPAELDDASRLLLKAAALIEERGHCQGDYTLEGRFCFMGALSRVGGEETDTINTATGRFIDRHGNYVCWNDRPGRTKDEVVAAMRAVALGL